VLSVIDAQRASVEDLIRLLASRSETDSSDEPPPDGAAEEVVLDLLVDGSRYLLVRLPKPFPESAHLSPREQEIVRLVAQGHSNKIIGDVLNISSWTVCTHLRRIFAKIGVGSRAAMVARLGIGVGRRAAQNGRKAPARSGADAYELSVDADNGNSPGNSKTPVLQPATVRRG
jgi:DNA-binding CsgD family transcriptional regulator